MHTKDYYRIMGLTPDASEEEIKSAYRKLARQYHPDINRDDSQGTERLKEINDAYHVLGNKERKDIYDMMYARGISDNPFMADAFMHTDLEMISRAFSIRSYKAPRGPFCKQRGFGTRGCQRRRKRWQ